MENTIKFLKEHARDVESRADETDSPFKRGVAEGVRFSLGFIEPSAVKAVHEIGQSSLSPDEFENFEKSLKILISRRKNLCSQFIECPNCESIIYGKPDNCPSCEEYLA